MSAPPAVDRIHDGLSLFGCPVERWWLHPRINTPNGPLARFGPPRPLSDVSGADPLPARVYEGQWIVDCPDCSGADFVWVATALTMCGSCGNREVRRKWRRVAVPENRKGIERALLARPDPATRNWLPGETLSVLVSENGRAGL